MKKNIDIIKIAGSFKADSPTIINPAEVVTGEWVRWKCRFGCDGYNSSLVCPPFSPAPEDTRKLLNEYRTGIFFEVQGCDLSFCGTHDARKRESGRYDVKEIAVNIERELFLAGFYKAFGLGAGPCRLCTACAFEKGCRHAYLARPSMEACGIDVFASARKFGFEIDTVRDEKDETHFFGLVLVE
jgi:predicted metal-binding protein